MAKNFLNKNLIRPNHPFRIFIYIILALGLLVGGYFTLKASQTSTEGRSKAAKEGKTYARWEFNGVTTEGWTHLGLQSLAVVKGKLNALMSNTPESSYIIKNNINAKMDRGNKKLSLRMAVGKAQVLPPEDGPTPTYAILDESGSSDAGGVDCTVSSNGVNTCTVDGSTEPGQESGGIGLGYVDPSISGIPISPPDPSKCVPRPPCEPGSDCLLPLLEPRDGWCPDSTPTPSCKPCADPRGYCPLEEYGDPIGGWCPPGTPPPLPPPCQSRPACLDARPACKIPTPIGGWCPSGQVFTFDVMYAYEEMPVGGGRVIGSVVPRRVEKVIQLKGKANGRFYRYNVALPEIAEIKVVDLKITFTSGVNPGAKVAFDWIRLIGAKIGGEVPPPITASPTRGLGQCGTPCSVSRDCASGFKCIQPRVGGQITQSKVCALSTARNNRGYVCRSGEN